MDIWRHVQDMLFHCKRGSTTVLNLWYDADLCGHCDITPSLSVQAQQQDFKRLTKWMGKIYILYRTTLNPGVFSTENIIFSSVVFCHQISKQPRSLALCSDAPTSLEERQAKSLGTRLILKELWQIYPCKNSVQIQILDLKIGLWQSNAKCCRYHFYYLFINYIRTVLTCFKQTIIKFELQSFLKSLAYIA